MTRKLKWVETTDLVSERQMPEGGWKPVCSVEQHTWKVRFETGSFDLECVDPHTQSELDEMEPTGEQPGCTITGEELGGELGPFKLEWHIERYGPYGEECDTWVEPVMM